MTTGPGAHDLLLSSGFLAFARHVGALAAIEDAGVPIDAVVGTSSGALIGALWASGMPAAQIASALAEKPPYSFFSMQPRLWEGAFSLAPLVRWLCGRLPATFADLPRPFATGVIGPGRVPRLLTEGNLPRAVVASCAIPGVFSPIDIDGVSYRDGGVADRLMFGPWVAWRGRRPVIAHVVDRSAGHDPNVDLEGVTVLRSPKSGANFFSLGDVAEGVAVSRRAAAGVLAGWGAGG